MRSFIWTALALTACSGDGGDSAEPLTRYETEIGPIWADNCSGCHLDGSESGSLNMDEGASAIVGVPSSDQPTMNLIEPNDTDNSYIWLKLNGTQSDPGNMNEQMPPSGALGLTDLDTIETWINDGAPTDYED